MILSTSDMLRQERFDRCNSHDPPIRKTSVEQHLATEAGERLTHPFADRHGEHLLAAVGQFVSEQRRNRPLEYPLRLARAQFQRSGNSETELGHPIVKKR